MATVEELVGAISKETSDVDSLLAFIGGLKTQLQDALAQAGQLTPEQQAAIDGVFERLNANDQAIADAMAQNVG
jgi:hypothetical protein